MTLMICLRYTKLSAQVLFAYLENCVSNTISPVLQSTARCHEKIGLCIKVGRGQGDRDIGTRVWGLGTSGRETRDLRTSTMGRGDVWDGDAGTSNTGTQGRRDVNGYCKSRR